MYKQVIIVRKDLNMSHGKMAAQVSHASMAFLTTMIRESAVQKTGWGDYNSGEEYHYETFFELNRYLFEEWIDGAFTKTVLEAKNKTRLLKAAEMAKEEGLQEGIDYFLIYDNCYTELTPEEENGRTLTCIGFAPMDSETIDRIGKKYHLYMG